LCGGVSTFVNPFPLGTDNGRGGYFRSPAQEGSLAIIELYIEEEWFLTMLPLYAVTSLLDAGAAGTLAVDIHQEVET
jgi:hypothetical protein